MSRRARDIAHGLLRGALALLALGLALVTALAMYLSSADGREQLARRALLAINRHIRGELTLERLATLGLGSLELRGVRVYAPAGNELVRLERVEAALSLRRLLHGELILTRLELAHGQLDLRSPTDSERGLAGAFAPRENGIVATASDERAPLELGVQRLRVDDVALALPEVAGLGALSARGLTLEASAVYGESAAIDVAALALWRDDVELATITLKGALNDQGEPSHLALQAKAGASELELASTFRYRRGDDPMHLPLDATLELRAVTAELLAHVMGDPTLAHAFHGPASLSLAATGTARALSARARLDSAGGPATLLAQLTDASRLALELSAEHFVPARVLPGAPSWPLTTTASLELTRATSERAARLVLRARSALADTPLPALALEAELWPGELRQLELTLSHETSRVSARGSLARSGRRALALDADLDLAASARLASAFGLELPAGSGRLRAALQLIQPSPEQLDVSGSLASQRIELASLRFTDWITRVAVRGPLAAPSVDLSSRWSAFERAGVALTPGWLTLRGGPRRYRLAARAGAARLGSFELSGQLERRAHASIVQLRGAGTLREQPWSIALEPSTLDDRGTLRSPGLTLTLAGQRASVRGSYGQASSTLELRLDAVDLQRVAQLVAPELGLSGSVSGRLSARGSVARPTLSLELSGEHVALRGRPALDAQVSAELNALEGRFALHGELSEARENAAPGAARLALELDAHSTFDGRRPLFAAWLEGEHRAKLELARLESDLLHEFGGVVLPARFTLGGRLELTTQRGAPSLSWQGDARLQPHAKSGTADTQQLVHRLGYDAGQLSLTLDASDAQGQWLRSSARLELLPTASDAPTVPELVRHFRRWYARLPALLERAAWQLELAAEPRTFATLQAPGELARARGWGKGSARRATGEEPSGHFELGLADVRPASVAKDCSPGHFAGQAVVHFADGNARAELSLSSGQRALGQLEASARLPYLPLVRGEPDALSALAIAARLERLPLASLPFACRQVRGSLSAQARLRDLLGAKPSAELTATLDGFSLGGDQLVDVQAKLTADAAQLTLDSELLAAGQRSRVHAMLPLVTRERWPALDRERPLRVHAELAELPLAPFVRPTGAISYATGSLSGEVTASGSAAQPKLAGKLQLNDMAFTATALAQPLSEISGEVAFDDDSVVLKGLSARDGDGVLTLDGRVNLRAGGGADARLELATRKFPLRKAGQIVATTSARLRLDTQWTREGTVANLVLREFDTWLESGAQRTGLALTPHPDVRVDTTVQAPGAPGEPTLARAKPDPETPPRTAPERTLRLVLDAGEDFWIKRADFALKINAKLQLTRTPASAPGAEPKTRIDGRVAFERGYLELLGKIFQIERGGTVRFTGNGEAIIDLTASCENRRSRQIVKVHVTGSSTSPQLTFTLNDETIDAGRAFQAIYGSQSNGNDAEEAQAQANQLLSAMTAGLVTRNLRRSLGSLAPILMVEPGAEQESTQIRAGFELDTLVPPFLRDVVTGMYVEGIFSSEAKDSQTGESQLQRGVLVELYFPYNLVTSGRYGPDTTWSIDLGWQP